jgi:hypothetical protein
VADGRTEVDEELVLVELVWSGDDWHLVIPLCAAEQTCDGAFVGLPRALRTLTERRVLPRTLSDEGDGTLKRRCHHPKADGGYPDPA